MKKRLDEVMVQNGMVQSRAHAARLIKLGKVDTNGEIITKAGALVFPDSKISIIGGENYVSRAGFKLASVAKKLEVKFKDKVVLDVGSSTGGFTDFAIQNGAKKVIAVDVGTDQLHHSLRVNPIIELYEKTDIRDIKKELIKDIDLALIDLSFISVRDILSGLLSKLPKGVLILAMIKPQFEAGDSLKHKGVIKNDTMRRDILKSFEEWVKDHAVILDKADSEVTGAKGNRERFYLLRS